MHRLHRKVLALTLTAVLAFGTVPAQGIFAAEDAKKTQASSQEDIQYERIDIRTAEEFAEFASKCYLDSWSENKYVSLKADIDLAGTDIRIIPVFNGVFDGVGHTISGFDYTGDGYIVGLFRYVERQGLIQNLTLKGTVEAENQKECIGSLCGVNYGTIKNCAFQGTVSGRSTVGGLVGINGDTGVITGCSVKGRVTGYYSTGGIAGINHGTLNYCSNRAGINDDSAWVEQDDEMGTGMGILESLASDDNSELYSGVDTGGIAGYSDGMITRCSNTGTVGYEHTGYNIGGIAGRQSGVVSLCTNSGTVYGRKDIGGIVGQMEPYIEVNEAESIRKAVDKLHDLIDKTINDMQASKDGVKRDFDTLTQYSDNAVDAADALAEQIGDFVDDNLDQAQALVDRLDHVMEMTPAVFDDFEAAENSFTNAVNALKEVSSDLGRISDIGDEAYDVSRNKRITLLHTVGGYIVANSYNPSAGEEVEIKVELDESQGDYHLTRIDVAKASDGEKITTLETAPYIFTMPVENVRVEAYFEPGEGILIRSDDADSSFDRGPEPSEIETETETDSETETESETETQSSSIAETEDSSTPESSSAAESETENDSTTGSNSAAETEGSSTAESSSAAGSGTESSTEGSSTTETSSETEGGSTEDSSTTETSSSENGSTEGSSTTETSGTESGSTEGSSTTETSGAAGSEAQSSTVDSSTTESSSSDESVAETQSSSGGSNRNEENGSEAGSSEESNNDGVSSSQESGSDADNSTAGSGTTELSKTTLSDTEAELRVLYGAGASFLGGAAGDVIQGGESDDSVGGNEDSGIVSDAASASKDKTSNEADSDKPSNGEGNDKTSVEAGDDKPNDKAESGKPSNKVGNEKTSDKAESNDSSDQKDNKWDIFDKDDEKDDDDKDASDKDGTAGTGSVIKISSNLSGSASCLPNGSKDKATVTAEPSGGYTVEYVTLDGSRIAPDSGNSYSFPLKDDSEYSVYIHFRKVTTKSGTVENAKSEIEYAIREAQDAIQKINDRFNDKDTISAAELQKMLSATTTVMENIHILADIYGDKIADTFDAVNRDLSSTSNHLKSALDSVKNATRHTRDIANYMNGQPDINFTKLGAEYDYNRVNLHNQLEAISASLSNLTNNASYYSDVVNADLKAVNDQINVIFNLLADRLTDVQKLGLDEFYEDVDDQDIESITTGRTEACKNKGLIKGDINVGGIAGSMSIDDEDLEDSAAGSIEYELGNRYITKCLVTGSVNEGYVTAKKNGAGGICGYMNHGIIIDSESYGSVESTEGDYVGGICGESFTIIKRCYTLCSVSGNRNVGGIAGYADTLKDCYSMAEVLSENGRAGAIAGQLSGQLSEQITGYNKNKEELDETSGPKVANNYYVGEAVHGIDNISYTGVAEPISYEDLLAVEQLPAEFEHLKVIYKVEDTYLGSEEVKYGERLDKLHFPQIPGKEGFYGEWPDVSDRIMNGTIVVEAEYKNNVTVVQSNNGEGAFVEDEQQGQWQKSYALVEDIFTENTVLNAKISDIAPPAEAEGKQYVVYDVTLENSGLNEAYSFSLRILNPYEDATVYGCKDGVWTELESKIRGQYLQVSMTGTQEYFCVVENTSNRVMLIACAAAAVVVLILLVVMVKKASARRKQRRQRKEQEKKKEEK